MATPDGKSRKKKKIVCVRACVRWCLRSHVCACVCMFIKYFGGSNDSDNILVLIGVSHPFFELTSLCFGCFHSLICNNVIVTSDVNCYFVYTVM